MSDILTCLQGVIGISRNPCICFDDGRQEEYGESLSGYYMDHPDYGLPLTFPQAIHQCEHNNLWELCEEVRQDAILQFVTELTQKLNSNRSVRKIGTATGKLGVAEDRDMINPGAFSGLVLDLKRYKGISVQINEIRLRGDGANGSEGTFGIFLEDEIIRGDITQREFTGTWNNGWLIARPDKPLRVDTIDDAGNCSNIYIQAIDKLDEYNVADTPMKNTNCGSCNGRRSKDEFAKWFNWFTPYGVAGPDIETIHLQPRNSNKSYGMQVSLTLTCSSSWLCQNIDWMNDDWGRVVAETILLFSNELLCSKILISDKANVYTAVRSQELFEKREYIREQIPSRLEWLVDQFPHGISDCYSCHRSVRKAAILA